MDRNEALVSLDAVSQTDRKMAQKMHWPFWRHALFGIAEGLLVIGLGANGAIGATAMGGGVACLLLLMYGDRQRDGMLVSGFKGKRTRPLMWAIMVLVIGSLRRAPRPSGRAGGQTTTSCSSWIEPSTMLV